MVQLLLTSRLAAKVALLRVKALFIEESTLFWDMYSGFLLKPFDCMMRVVLSIFFFTFVLLKKILFFDFNIELRQIWWRWKAYSEGYNFVLHEKFVISIFIRQKLSFCVICTLKSFYFVLFYYYYYYCYYCDTLFVQPLFRSFLLLLRRLDNCFQNSFQFRRK
jgi:hypothetical protein